MANILDEKLREKLVTQRQTSGKSSEASKKRLHNILWIQNLDRTGLEFHKREKQLLIHETNIGELLYIQFPGKESINKDPKPWDFRPKLCYSDGSYIDDLTFKVIWDILVDSLEAIGAEQAGLGSILAILFYRMAFMCDHELEDLDIAANIIHFSDGKSVETRENHEALGSLYVYRPNPTVIEGVAKILPSFAALSLEAFLHYNDLLAWNEDCKYYYRDVVGGDKDWNNATGRVNNLLSHVTLLGWLSGHLSLSDLLMKFVRGRGVAPCSKADIETVCEGLVKYAKP